MFYNDDAYNKGYNAYQTLKVAYNPYDPFLEPFDYRDWDMGWCDAYDAANSEISDD